MILETARLILRPVRPQDHARLHALFTQPGVRGKLDPVFYPSATFAYRRGLAPPVRSL
jgi:RimJ/RimL family protein N-acetyltransferase